MTTDPISTTIVRPYKIEVTRVHKKTYAPTGKCYVVIRYKAKMTKYESSILVISKMLNNEALEKLTDLMWGDLRKKYSI